MITACSPRVMRLLVLAALVAAGTAPATAQLRMPKIKNPLARVVAGDPNAPKTGDVTFDDDVLEITAERLQQLAVGLDAEQRMAARVDAQDLVAIARADSIADAKYQRDRAAYDATVARYEACAEKETAGPAAAAQALVPSATDQQRLEAVAERVRAAQARGDMAEVMRLTDSLVKVGNRAGTAATALSADAQRKVQAACGTPPGAAPASPQRTPVLTYNDISHAGQQASGFTGRQYRILRERVAPVVLGVSPGSMVFTRIELDAIEAGTASFAPYRDILRRF